MDSAVIIGQQKSKKYPNLQVGTHWKHKTIKLQKSLAQCLVQTKANDQTYSHRMNSIGLGLLFFDNLLPIISEHSFLKHCIVVQLYQSNPPAFKQANSTPVYLFPHNLLQFKDSQSLARQFMLPMRQAYMQSTVVDYYKYMDVAEQQKPRYVSWRIHYRVGYGEAVYIVFDDGHSYRMDCKNDESGDLWTFHRSYEDSNRHWYSYYVGKWNQNIWLRPVTYHQSPLTIQKEFTPKYGYYHIDDWTHHTD